MLQPLRHRWYFQRRLLSPRRVFAVDGRSRSWLDAVQLDVRSVPRRVACARRAESSFIVQRYVSGVDHIRSCVCCPPLCIVCVRRPEHDVASVLFHHAWNRSLYVPVITRRVASPGSCVRTFRTGVGGAARGRCLDIVCVAVCVHVLPTAWRAWRPVAEEVHCELQLRSRATASLGSSLVFVHHWLHRMHPRASGQTQFSCCGRTPDLSRWMVRARAA